MAELYKAQLANEVITVYPDKIVQTIKGAGKEVTIPLNNISSVDTGFFFQAAIKIKTNSGETHTLHCWPKVKKELAAAINNARGN